MPKLSIVKGTTSKLVDVFIQDSSVTTGAGLTGLAYNTGSLTGYYYREGAASAVAITLATMTLGTWATGGFIVVDGTNMPGAYQLGIPDAALASGANSVVVMLKGAANMVPCVLEIELTAVNNQSATAFITGVNSLAPPTNWNLTSIDGSGRLDIIKVAGATQTARDLGASVLLSPGTGTGQVALTSGAVIVQSGTGTGQLSLSSGSVAIQGTVKKNVAIPNYPFLMRDTVGAPRTGLTVTAERKLDAGSFAACANSVSEIANGWYEIDLAAADLNGDTVALSFTATGSSGTYATILTIP